MVKIKEWAELHGINTEDILPPLEGYNNPCKRTAREVAVRTIILHAVAAAGYGIDRDLIIEWLENQNLWEGVSTNERNFFLSRKPSKLSEEDRKGSQWLQEAQWALLWTIKKIKGLGLPTKTCDTIKLVDDIMPEFGGETGTFVSTAELRPVQEIGAEYERIHKLYYYTMQADKQDEEIPEDLIFGVLFQRYYAFKWLTSENNWDYVKTKFKEGDDHD